MYGLENIAYISNDQLKKFYFFSNSDFFRDRDRLDGAVITFFENDRTEARLFLNPLSERYEAMKVSALTRAFGDEVGDPLRKEAAGNAFILREPLQGCDEDTRLAHLASVYETGPLMTLPMTGTAFTVVEGPTEGNA